MVGLLALLACNAPKDVVRESAFDTGPSGPPEALIRQPVFRTEVGAWLEFDGSRSQRTQIWRWRFGDGASDEGRTVRHLYSAPGRYTASLEVENGVGQTDAVSFPVIVTWPPAEEAPQRSAPLADMNSQLWVVMPDHDQLAIYNLSDWSLAGRREVCDTPRSVAAVAGRLAVACQGDDRVYLDTERGQEALQLPRGSRPFGVVIAEGAAWVSLQGLGAVAKLPLDDPESIEITEIGPDLRGLAWSEGQLIVSRHRSPDEAAQWWVVDTETMAATEYSLPIDPGPDSDVGARGLPNHLQRLAVRPDGRVVAFAGNKANIERGLYNEGQALTHETTVRADLRVAALDRFEGEVGVERMAADFDNRDLVADVAYSPLGDVLYAAHAGAEVVDFLDPWTLARLGGVQGVAAGLDGLWLSADGETLAVLSSVDRELTLFDVGDLSAPAEGARLDLGAGLEEPLSEEILAGKRLFGRSVDPRMSTDAYVSCASCHLDGEHDGRTWDFTDRGEGLRNTRTLRGLDLDSSPLHWTANFDEVQDFENDIRGPQAGQGFLSEADWAETMDTLGAPKAGRSAELDALAAYVRSLSEVPRSPYREADGTLSPLAEAGGALFTQQGCDACHPAPTHSDSAWIAEGEPLLHDVGTLSEASGARLGGALTGLDTPSLRGLHESAPYLHDGSAATLREVLVDRNPDGLHGDTRGLTEDELDALEAFLLSIE